MVFGQVVIGPPGSGKTTYCNGMAQFLRGLGRKVAVVNLDPASVCPNIPDILCQQVIRPQLRQGVSKVWR